MAAVPSNATLLAAFPEFNGATSALVTQKLTEAARRTRTDSFPSADAAADAVMLRAAILLILSPYGHKMRSENPEQYLAYQMQLRELQRASTMGDRVF